MSHFRSNHFAANHWASAYFGPAGAVTPPPPRSSGTGGGPGLDGYAEERLWKRIQEEDEIFIMMLALFAEVVE